MNRHRHALQILALAACLLAVWRGFLAGTGARADFGDSNYQSNLIRLEDYTGRAQPPTVVLAGSSVTGRLLPRYFAGTGVPDVGNLGLDGSSALVGLEVIAAGRSLPRVVLVETYLLGRPWGPNDSALMRAMDGAGARLARRDRLFAAASRPSALLYSWLKARSPGGAGRPAAEGGPRADRPADPPDPGPDSPAPAGPDAADGLPERWRRVIDGLKERGVRVVLMDVPTGRATSPGGPGPDLADLAMREMALERFDLRAGLASDGVVPAYTDGLHLDAPSAEAACRLLARWIRPDGAGSP